MESWNHCIQNPLKPTYMKSTAFLFLLFLAGCNSQPQPKKIRVAGEGKIRVIPDQVTLTINVSFTRPQMAEAVRQTQETVDTVLHILERFGQKQRDIKTSSISANKQYSYNGRTEQFAGFQAQQTIDFVLNDMSRFTELTGRLLETRINSISQIQFSHSRADSILREADLLAYDDALQSANKLCKRSNVQLGKLLFVSNSDHPQPDADGYSSGYPINTYNKAYGGRGFRIAPEVIEFRRSLVSEFEIN